LTDSITIAAESKSAGLSATSAGPTRIRWRIIGIVMFIMAITALNRLNLSIAGKYIEEEFSFDTLTMGRVFSSFLWGYGVFQIPWGYICDRYGPRRTLTISILCFSVGAAAMGFVPHLALVTGVSVLAAMRLVRFLTGLGEAAVTSSVTRVIASWTAARERGLASGLQVCGLGLGGTLTPIFIAWTMIHWGWRVAFYACSALGFMAVFIWSFYSRDWPELHPDVNDPELAQIHPGAVRGDSRRRNAAAKKHVPWGKILSNRSVWGLIVGYGFQGYTFYVYYNWFYFYAVKVRHLGLMEAAIWTSAPFLAMALLSPVGGWFSDRVAQVTTRRRGRLTAVWLGMGLSAVLLLAGSHIPVTVVALPMIALAAGFNMFAAANFWAACIDLAPDFSASLSALMNTLGSAGGAISSTATAYVAVHYNWGHALDLAAIITILSAVLFSAVNVDKRVEEDLVYGVTS
jgi:ACS family glucarate transporter-like MFS transporter